MKANELSRKEKLTSRLDAAMDIALKLPGEICMISSFEEYLHEYALKDIEELTEYERLGFEDDYKKYIEYTTAYNVIVKGLYCSFYDILSRNTRC